MNNRLLAIRAQQIADLCAVIGNAKAVMEKADKLEMVIDGKPWEQNPFTYQAKCLMWLREAYEALSEKDLERVNKVLDGTDVLQLFS